MKVVHVWNYELKFRMPEWALQIYLIYPYLL